MPFLGPALSRVKFSFHLFFSDEQCFAILLLFIHILGIILALIIVPTWFELVGWFLDLGNSIWIKTFPLLLWLWFTGSEGVMTWHVL